jgi:anthranilate phosphoribosyltransferase
VELGVKISSDIDEIERNLREKNICFLFAPFFHESLKNLAAIRKSIGVPTIFNFLGPLINPANTKLQLIGTSRYDVIKKMLSAQKNVEKIYIVHGFDGMDEITLTDNSYLLRLENGQILPEEIINPEKFGFKKIGLESLIGKDPKYNAEKLCNLLAGEKSAYRDIVVLNSAFAFKLADKVEKIEDGIDLAKSMIDDGTAIQILKKLTLGSN